MKNLGYIAFAVLGLIWGTTFIFTKWAAEFISPAQIVLLRVLFGFVPILIYALCSGALKAWHWRYAHHFLVMAVLATALYYYAFAKGTTLLLSSVAGMLSGAIPLFTFVASFIFLRDEPMTKRMGAGVGLGFLGVLLIAQPWHSSGAGINLQGVLDMVIGSLSVGCSFVYARRFLSGLQISPVALCTYQIGLGLLIILALTDLHGIMNITNNARAMWGVSLGLGLLGTGVAYILYYTIVERLGAVVASSATYIPPVIAIAIGTLVVGEPLQPLHMLAIAAILGGVYLLQTGRRPTRQRAPASNGSGRHALEQPSD
jgi:drug/metabolite transporter (DMT)-like permease